MEPNKEEQKEQKQQTTGGLISNIVQYGQDPLNTLFKLPGYL